MHYCSNQPNKCYEEQNHLILIMHHFIILLIIDNRRSMNRKNIRIVVLGDGNNDLTQRVWVKAGLSTPFTPKLAPTSRKPSRKLSCPLRCAFTHGKFSQSSSTLL